jgi:hypothetical protein
VIGRSEQVFSTPPVPRWLRMRQLAGDARAGVRVRAAARRQHYAFLRRVWRPFTVVLLATIAFLWLITYLEPSQFIKGLTLGAGIVGVLAALAMMTQQATGTAQTGMGATAEQWTASELRQLRKAGGRVVNHLALERGDIDHVLIAPSGLYAVETKWSANGWNLTARSDRLDAALSQVRRNARHLRLWHPVAAAQISTVRPVLFLWGGTEVPKPERPTRIDDVDIVYGIKASQVWRAAVANRPGPASVTDSTIDAVWQAISTHAKKRDTHDATREPAPPTITRILIQIMLVALITPLALLGSLKIYLITQSLPWFTLAAGAATLLGLAARRIAALRIAGTAASAGFGTGLALILAAALYSTLT